MKYNISETGGRRTLEFREQLTFADRVAVDAVMYPDPLMLPPKTHVDPWHVTYPLSTIAPVTFMA